MIYISIRFPFSFSCNSFGYLERYCHPCFQVVIYYLNKYDNLSRQEIEKLVLELKEDSKNTIGIRNRGVKSRKRKIAGVNFNLEIN
jgi:hypothetical protein